MHFVLPCESEKTRILNAKPPFYCDAVYHINYTIKKAVIQ